MDLKSMLNDSVGQRPPPLHTPHSSYDARAAEHNITPSEPQLRAQSHSHSHSSSQSQSQPQPQPQPNRTVPYPPPLQPVDSRAPPPGGYFGIQSPHPNNINSASTHASTPSGGPQSGYAKSPGAQSQSYTSRENTSTHSVSNPGFAQSPSLAVNQPPTPGASYQQPSHHHTPVSAHSQTGPPPPYAHAQSPRGSHPPNGQHRQLSPNAPHPYPQPATPLGPPIQYNKVSPQAQRPPSQGYDQHYRKSSHGSVGSMPGREHGLSIQQTPDNPHPGSGQKQSIPDLERIKERDRSVSVSPKTIPQPSPYRQTSISSQTGSIGRPSIQSPQETRAMSAVSDAQMGGSVATIETRPDHQQDATSRTSTGPGSTQPSLSRGQSIQQETSDAISSPAPPPNLKRNASFLSDRSHSPQMQPWKRLKRDEIPIYAQSARQKPLRLGSSGKKVSFNRPAGRPSAQPPTPAAQQPPPQQAPPQQPGGSGPPPFTNGKQAATAPMTAGPVEFQWEPSIANIPPYEDLTRQICDWIYQKIGLAVPPSGGAMFEIEAKIGEIFDIENQERLKLPVKSETIFDKQDPRFRTKFESSMNMEQHMLLNKYLNDLTREAFLQAQKGERQEILYDHPHEIDEFFELRPEGLQNLNPSILEYFNARQKPRVRRTRDRNTGQLKAQIIKTRVADIEIYNPNTDFDCRISISVESPWEGDPNWLIPMGEGNEGRHKDRMSYRHMAYQVDLTQVSHDNKPNMEHELEVEISTEQIRRELDNLQNQRPSRYEDLVRGLIDNVRLLCRKGSLSMVQRRG